MEVKYLTDLRRMEVRAASDCAHSSSFPATKLRKRERSSMLASVVFSSAAVASMASSVD